MNDSTMYALVVLVVHALIYLRTKAPGWDECSPHGIFWEEWLVFPSFFLGLGYAAYAGFHFQEIAEVGPRVTNAFYGLAIFLGIMLFCGVLIPQGRVVEVTNNTQPKH